MASVTQRFFAIPELLELVLLEVGGNATHLTSPCFPRELYVLKRVNRSFAAMIEESPRIRLSMGLGSPLKKALRIGQTEPATLTCLRPKDLVFPPFKYYENLTLPYEALPFKTRSTKPKHLWLSYNVAADCFAKEYQGSLGYRAGLKGTSGRVYRDAHQTWRKMKLAPANTPVVVHVNVFRPRKKIPVRPAVWSSYTEWIRFRAGEGTLGDLADFFEEIGRRSREEQEEGRSLYCGAYWVDARKQFLEYERRKAIGVRIWKTFKLAVKARILWLCILVVKWILLWFISEPIRILKLFMWLFAVVVVLATLGHYDLKREEERERRKILEDPAYSTERDEGSYGHYFT